MFSRAFIILFINLAFIAWPQQGKEYTYQTPSDGGTGKVYFGREIAKIMDFSGSAWLERKTREAEEHSDLTIEKLPINESSVVADIGAGTGYYTFRICNKVPQGRVYAVEVQDDAVNYLKNKVGQQDIKNVTVVKGREQSPELPESSIDLAMMVDVYHELLYPHEMLENIRKALKPNGKLLLIEYKAEDPKVEIRPLHKMSVKQATKELEANGFKLVEDGEFLPIQHFLLFQKS
ncbi:MAG TPA: class I SAM-dependent methyltransferase [Mucilaginibacter sp.]|jgi:precorrin-6B methylase 2|nr:class I SAM-dependent methyltransferase [Mucilaginibacter sp.]